jgi:excisionase family DNA binding protein
MDIETYIDAQGVATFLQISRRRVLDMTRAGTIPAYKLGAIWRYKLSEVDKSLQNILQNASLSGILDRAGDSRKAKRRA